MTAPAGALAAPQLNLLDGVGASLGLRAPNVVAVRTIAQRLHEHASNGAEDCFEAVVDSATGMGKSFIMAGAIDYYAQLGVRNFAIITPGRAIQDKTVRQFSPGHPKSLADQMETRPLVVHPGNFTTAAVAAEFEDPERVKLFVFTVQSLLPVGRDSEQRRRTRTFNEDLGKEFYGHLQELSDLLVFADEHHCYGGPKFSQAVRGLDPLALIGLTATPDEDELASQQVPVIYRYPLAAAISAGYVKTPVIVGRKDDNTDERTQLLDGGVLLHSKQAKLEQYATETGAAFINPIMLVCCQNIDHARETVEFLRSQQYFEGRYGGDGAVLEVHSAQPDEALEALDHVEDPGNPCRIIVQVGMLKEGWDVKNVYVICSLRSSVSDVLTEQTLGRGLRLPFGARVDDEDYRFLNELEVVAHERYRELLRQTDALTEQFIDYQTVEAAEAPPSEPPPAPAPAPEPTEPDTAPDTVPVGVEVEAGEGGQAEENKLTVTDTEGRLAQAEQQAARELLSPSAALDGLQVPKTEAKVMPGSADLSHVTEAEPFRSLGRAAAADPEQFLPRTQLTGLIDEATRTASVVAGASETEVEAASALTTAEEGRALIIARVLGSAAVSSRQGAAQQVGRLLDWVLEGAASKSDLLLTRYPERVAVQLSREIIKQLNALVKVRAVTTQVVASQPFAPRPRLEREQTSPNRSGGKFQQGVGYTGWTRGLYEQAWFDSSPEREMANILDDENSVEVWVRLHRQDFPILWAGAERSYNPDFLAKTDDDHYWVLEVKDDRHAEEDEVQQKRHAALAWANQVNASGQHGTWHYLLVSESDLRHAKGSWSAVVKACSP